MQSLIYCVVDEHDLRLVALAALVCALGCYATFSLGTHAYLNKRPMQRLFWGGACVAATACSVWATHFIAILAFHPGAPVGFDPWVTVASLGVAIVLIGAGFAIATFATNGWLRTLGGVVSVGGIAAMHYLSISAYHVPGHLEWNWALVGQSLLVSGALGALTAHTPFHADKRVRALAPPMLILTVCALHFIGMSAVTVVYDPSMPLTSGVLNPSLIAMCVSGAAFVVVGFAIVAAALERLSQRRRAQERHRLHTLADVAVEGLLICRGEKIVSCNLSARRLAADDEEDACPVLAGSELEAWLSLPVGQVPEGREIDAVLTTVTNLAVPVKLIRRPMMLDGREHMVVAVRDQRDRLKAEADLRDLALRDVLTGLPNRAALNLTLHEHAESRRGRDQGYAVMLLDLDRFKIVNDTMGHAAGDILLRRVADRLSSALRPEDTAARLGGDEFAILQRDVRDPMAVRTLAARIVDLLGRPFIIEGQVVNVGASIGVALAPSDGVTPDILLRNADLALYKAKEEGRGVYRLYEANLDARMRARRELEVRLRRATARQEFELHYQPLADARTGRITGVEALIRWMDPEHGMIPPAEFISVAEETGLIANIGHWVLRTACKEAMTWAEPIAIAVNLSPVQFRDARLADAVKGVLASTGLDPTRLELEITESLLLTDESRTLNTLNELRALGVRISMDDFGTGYSSLSYLRKFPFDKIKVDQSFVRASVEDAESAAIVKAVISLGGCLGMTTTVEGVETQAQYDLTTFEGCDQVQGYFISRPLTSTALRSFLDDRRAPDADIQVA